MLRVISSPPFPHTNFVCSENSNFVKLNLSQYFPSRAEKQGKLYLRNVLKHEERHTLCQRAARLESPWGEQRISYQKGWVAHRYSPSKATVVSWEGYVPSKPLRSGPRPETWELCALVIITWHSEFHSSQLWHRSNNMPTNNCAKKYSDS